jgi:hypothetical protein
MAFDHGGDVGAEAVDHGALLDDKDLSVLCEDGGEGDLIVRLEEAAVDDGDVESLFGQCLDERPAVGVETERYLLRLFVTGTLSESLKVTQQFYAIATPTIKNTEEFWAGCIAYIRMAPRVHWTLVLEHPNAWKSIKSRDW